MDPITAFFNALGEGFKLMTVIVEGQSPEVKERLWKQWADIVDGMLKLGKP